MSLVGNKEIIFDLKLGSLVIGKLSYSNSIWKFQYTKEFKEVSHIYNHISGFSNLDKVYESETLWEFFKIRIPGLKQPAIKEILDKENIDKTNKLGLLKRFGYSTISNPYRLEVVN